MREMESLIALTICFSLGCGTAERPVEDSGLQDASVSDANINFGDAKWVPPPDVDSAPPPPKGYHIIDGGTDGSQFCSPLGTFKIQSCCQGTSCRGDCVQYDDASIGCNCFGIVNGCPAKQECCAKQEGCVAETVCLGTN